jgi:tetratricopeptide (TPR) repeat protein
MEHVRDDLASARLPPSKVSSVYCSIAQAQAQGGDIAGALKTGGFITDDDDTRNLQMAVAGAQARAGDILAARRTAAAIRETLYRNIAFSRVIEGQVGSGDLTGAEATLKLVKDDDIRKDAKAVIAVGYANAGDIPKAEQIVRSLFQPGWSACSAYEGIAEAQAKQGDLAGVEQTLDLLLRGQQANQLNSQEDIRNELVKARIRVGDFEGAMRDLESATDSDRREAYGEMAEAMAGRGRRADALCLLAEHLLVGPPYENMGARLQALAAENPRDEAWFSRVRGAAVSLGGMLREIRHLAGEPAGAAQ